MQHKNLVEILHRLGWTKEATADAWTSPARGGTVYLSCQDEALILDGVHRVELVGEVAILTRRSDELYGAEMADVVAVRVPPQK
jgi:hypothetical protein